MRKATHRTATVAGLFAAFALMVTGCGTPQNQAGTTGSNGAALPSSNQAVSNQQGNSNQTMEPAHTKAMHWSQPPAMHIDTSKQYDAVFHTNYGDFTVQLFAKSAPETVNNFVFLAKKGFYNNDIFFRIIQSFMIQTGDPLNNGTGGPGYTIPDELPPKIPYGPGVVAMANTGQPHSGGSQFFICTGTQSTDLPPNYSEFGKVISGMSVVQQIAAIPVQANPQTGEKSQPTKTAYIESIDIQVK